MTGDDPTRSLVDYREAATEVEWKRQLDLTSQFPHIRKVEPFVAWFRERGGPVTVPELQLAGGLVNDYVGLLTNLRTAGLVVDALLAFAVADAWSSDASPLEAATRNVWLELFGATGYTVDGV